MYTYMNIFIFCSDIKYLCNKCAMLPFDVSVLPSECHHFNLLHSLSSWKPWYARIEEIWFVWHAHCVWNKKCVRVISKNVKNKIGFFEMTFVTFSLNIFYFLKYTTFIKNILENDLLQNTLYMKYPGLNKHS